MNTNDMDAPRGPQCACGKPSTYESGWCGTCRSSTMDYEVASLRAQLAAANERASRADRRRIEVEADRDREHAARVAAEERAEVMEQRYAGAVARADAAEHHAEQQTKRATDLEQERAAEWKRIDAAVKTFKFASMAGAVEALVAERDEANAARVKAEGEAAAKHEALKQVESMFVYSERDCGGCGKCTACLVLDIVQPILNPADPLLSELSELRGRVGHMTTALSVLIELIEWAWKNRDSISPDSIAVEDARRALATDAGRALVEELSSLRGRVGAAEALLKDALVELKRRNDDLSKTVNADGEVQKRMQTDIDALRKSKQKLEADIGKIRAAIGSKQMTEILGE